MKTQNQKNTLFLFLLLIGLSLRLSAAAISETGIVITDKVQTLEFYFKKGVWKAKLIVKQTVELKSGYSETFAKYLFYDENSSITKISRRNKGQLWSKVKPVVSDYQTRGVFTSDTKQVYFEYEFNKVGEVIDIKYEKVFNDFKFIDPLYFFDDFLVENCLFLIIIPNTLKVDLREFNFKGHSIIKEKFSEKNKVIYSLSLQDVKKRINFDHSPLSSWTQPHLIINPVSYVKGGVSYPLLQDVGQLYKWYAKLEKEIGNEPEYLETIVNQLTQGKIDDLEKIKSIYYWVQDNIRYIAFEEGVMGFRPESCQKVFGNKYGDCKGMANLAKQMLIIAGYDARLTWLGTNDIPYTYDLPSLLVDNHMICTVIHNDDFFFLDPTEKFGDFGGAYSRIEGREVLIENGEQFMLKKVPSASPQQNVESISYTCSLEEDGLLSGHALWVFKGDGKTMMLNFLANISKKEYKEQLIRVLGRGDKNVSVQIAELPALFERDMPLEINVDFQIQNHVIDLGEECYVNLETDFLYKDLEIEKERGVPYSFSRKKNIKITTNLHVPKGWEVRHLPEPLNIMEDKYHFSLKYELHGDVVCYSRNFEIKDWIILPKEFASWNDMVKQLNAFYFSPIVLEKK